MITKFSVYCFPFNVLPEIPQLNESSMLESVSSQKILYFKIKIYNGGKIMCIKGEKKVQVCF